MGKNNWLIKFLVGCLWTIIVASLAFGAKSIIANDRDSRSRDTAIIEKHTQDIKEQNEKHLQQNEKFNEALLEQNTTNGKIAEILAVLKTDIKYIKENGR